ALTAPAVYAHLEHAMHLFTRCIAAVVHRDGFDLAQTPARLLGGPVQSIGLPGVTATADHMSEEGEPCAFRHQIHAAPRAFAGNPSTNIAMHRAKINPSCPENCAILSGLLPKHQ